MKPACSFALTVLLGALVFVSPARAAVLTFEIFDPARDFPPYNDPGVQPFLAGYGYPEGFLIPNEYGDRIAGAQEPASPMPNDVIYRYGIAEGLTPHVEASYGPFSIFTGGPTLWREGYGDLNGILYQGSEGSIGNDYDILDIVLVGDADWDVVLHSIDLGGVDDFTINSVTVYDGVPFPFLTPMNQIYEQFNVNVPAVGHNTIDFGDLQSHIIWLRIDASNLGDDSINIGVDNIVFSEIFNQGSADIDPGEIAAALQPAEVPEATSLLVWLMGSVCAGAVLIARRSAQ
jgi:hypothetical protein